MPDPQPEAAPTVTSSPARRPSEAAELEIGTLEATLPPPGEGGAGRPEPTPASPPTSREES